jgi:hypothetical protein
LLSGNLAYQGAGANASVLYNCTLRGNTALPLPAGSLSSRGGGAYGCTLYDCTVEENQSGEHGGGLHTCTVYGGTIRNNACTNGGRYGGGAASSSIFNCLISGNAAYSGGGAYGCALSNCTLMANLVVTNLTTSIYPTGAGAAGSSGLTNCLIVANTNTANNGGGVYGSTMTGCLVASNYCGNYGAGFYGYNKANAYNCKFLDNRTANRGGGVYDASVYNSLIAGNYANGGYGGGAQDCYLWNCTVVSNVFRGSLGGGLHDCKAVTNCIVYFNYNDVGATNNYDNGTCTNFGYTCTWPAKANWDASNFTNDPRMVNWRARDYRLDRGSPCIDRGLSIGWMIAPADVRSKDLDGGPRVRGAGVDLGAYESAWVSLGTVVLIR